MADEPESEIKRAASYWDNVPPVPQRARWWSWPQIVSLHNRLISGAPAPNWNAGLMNEVRRRNSGRAFERGISIGCGGGGKELAWLKEGIVSHFDLFEISEARVNQGRETFWKNGLADKVNWRMDDGIAALEQGASYDLVYWDNSLHHMPDTPLAILASYRALQSGGMFVMNDFTGKNRFQWSETELHYGTAVRAGLAQRYLRNPWVKDSYLPIQLTRPELKAMIERDPTEAQDSERILPAVRMILPSPSVWLLGGSIYHLALNDILSNFEPVEDASLLESLLVLDQVLVQLGENQYAACLSTHQ